MGLNIFRCDCDFPHLAIENRYDSEMWINRGEIYFLTGEVGWLLCSSGIIKTTIPDRELRLYFKSVNGKN